MSIVTKEWTKKFEEAEYLDEIIEGLEALQKENNYSDEEMDNDLDVALWRAYVYNNMDSYEYYELSEKTLAKVKDKGVKSGVWCYRYSCALVYLRRFEEALEYSRLGTKVEPDYPWGWLQLGRLCYKFNLLDEAFNAIEEGLKLVPNDYEFLTLKDDIENDRGYAYANSHYINEEYDKSSEKRLIDIDDDKLYNEFLNKSDLEKKLDILHKENKNQEIIDIINSLPKEELTYNILGKLARAYNNNDEYDKGMEILLSVKDEGEKDSLWNFRIGYSCYYSGRLEEAKKYFERSLELNPEEPDADVLLRFTYSDLGTKKIDEGKPEEALEYYKKSRELARDTDGIIFSESDLAWAYDHLGKYEKAYEYLKNIISLGRDDIWLHSEVGFCLGGLGKYEEAAEEFKKAIEMGRDDSWIFARLGQVYRELEKYDEALETYFKGLEIDKNDIWLNSEVAWIYDTIKDDCNTGLKYLEKVKELGRDDIWINSEFGWVYNHLERYEEGLLYFEKAKEQGKDDIWLYSEIGYCLKRLARWEEALSYYQKANEMGRDDEWLNVEIGECLGEMGRIEEGIARLQKTLTLKDCDEVLVNSQIGYLYGKLNNSKEALKYLYKAEELGRKDVWLYSEIGWNLADDSETYEKALDYFNKAVELGRDDTWIDGQIGFVQSKLGNYKEAISRFERVYFATPEDNWIAFQLGAVYRKAGEITKAIEILEKSVENTPFRGWVELELAICYALIEEKEKAQEYLDKAELYIGGERENYPDVKKDFEMVNQLLKATSYLS